MLKYEEKLHLDKHYEKLQSSNLISKTASMLWSTALFILMYYLLKLLINYLPGIFSAKGNNILFTLWQVTFTTTDILSFIPCIIFFIYGGLKLNAVSRENHKVRDKDADTPSALLTDGMYKSVRHPMYGTFVMLQGSLFLSICSLPGIIIAILICAFQYMNALWEEKRQLTPVFGKEYTAYSKKVRHVLFTTPETVIFICLIIMNMIFTIL